MESFFVITVFTAVLESILAACMLGWPSLQYVLEQEGYFYHLCHNNTNNGSTVMLQSTNNSLLAPTCHKQEANFHLIFVLGLCLSQFFMLPNGIMLDHFGTRTTRILAASFYTVGAVLLAISSLQSPWLLYPAVILIFCLGGTLFLSNLQIANLLISHRGTIVALLSGGYDLGAEFFLLTKLCYDAGFKLKTLFYAFVGCCSLPWLRTFLLLPKSHIYHNSGKSGVYGLRKWWLKRKNKTGSFENTNDSRSEHIGNISENSDSSGPRTSVTKCFKNMLFWSNCFHASIIILRTVFFINSFLKWIKTFEKEENISYLTNIFVFVLGLGGFVAPLNGLVIDHFVTIFKKWFKDYEVLRLYALSMSMTLTSLLSIALSIAALVPHTYSSFVFCVLSKSFVFSGQVAFLIICFPYHHFGKLFGVQSIVVATMGFLQIALFQISVTIDPNFKFINIGLLILMIITLWHPILILIKAKVLSNENTAESMTIENHFVTRL